MKAKNIRAYILIRFQLGIEAKVILSELKTAVPDHTPSLKTVYRWMGEFKKNPDRVQDKPRSGRPISGWITSNIKRVKALIDDNSNIGYAIYKKTINSELYIKEYLKPEECLGS